MSLDLEQFAGKKEFPVLDNGDYEVIVKLTKGTTQDKSKDYLNCDFFVRDDCEQKFKGSHVFDKMWRDTTNPQWFDLKKSGTMLITQKGKEGYRGKFDEVDEFIQYMNDTPMIITVVKKYDDYSAKEVNEVKYLSYKPSKLGAYVKPEAPQAPATPNLEDIGNGAKGANLPLIDDEDVPF